MISFGTVPADIPKIEDDGLPPALAEPGLPRSQFLGRAGGDRLDTRR